MIDRLDRQDREAIYTRMKTDCTSPKNEKTSYKVISNVFVKKTGNALFRWVYVMT